MGPLGVFACFIGMAMVVFLIAVGIKVLQEKLND